MAKKLLSLALVLAVIKVVYELAKFVLPVVAILAIYKFYVWAYFY